MNLPAFLLVFLAIYGVVNAYLYVRGWQGLRSVLNKRAYTAMFLALSLSYIAGRALERVTMNFFTDLLVWIGSFWLAYLLYFFLAAVVSDLARGINRIVPFFPRFVTGDYPRFRERYTVGVVVVTTAVVLGGFINTLFPRTSDLTVSVEKPSWTGRSMTVVAVSDVHMGTIIGRMRVDSLVDRINAIRPDLVLLAGDILDEDVGPVMRKDLGSLLRGIRSRLGVYGIAGNHEYIGGVERTTRFLQDCGVVMLRDWSVRIDGALYLVGRDDRSIRRFAGRDRAHLHDLMRRVDRSLPVIVMDHQPYHLQKAIDNGIDLHLSGHTHAGQIWPLSCIVNAIYQVPSGARTIGGTVFYVSSGFGTWGAPVRIGNRPEIVRIGLVGPRAGQKNHLR